MMSKYYDELVTRLADARDELFEYERMVETMMINGPEFVIDEMLLEIKRLRKALKYYANEEIYEYEVLIINPDGTEHCEEPPVIWDGGKRAREALQNGKG